MSEADYGLAITTSTGVTGVAVGPLGTPGPESRAESRAVSRVVTTDRRHAEELTPMVHDALTECGVEVGDLSVLVVDIGPGRFTGLRVGLATVRALAFAAEIPVVGLSSLEVLAATVADAEGQPVTGVVDARRGEVFQQSFESGLQPVALGPADVGTAESLVSQAVGVVVGDGADLYAEVYRTAKTGIVHRPGRNLDPAVMLAMAGNMEAVPGPQVTPLYLRDPDVNPNIKTRPVTDRTAATPT